LPAANAEEAEILLNIEKLVENSRRRGGVKRPGAWEEAKRHAAFDGVDSR